MSDEQVFVDTNILIHAHDRDAGSKHEAAKACVAQLWNRERAPAVSIQVLQELYNGLLRKGVSQKQAEKVVSLYLLWEVVVNDAQVLRDGMKIATECQTAPWNGWILAAARRAGARQVWSEDLNPGQAYDGVVVVNPLDA